jgi:hypothetical protein
MIIPSSVNADRNLCAQMADSASFNVSKNFTSGYYGLRLRLFQGAAIQDTELLDARDSKKVLRTGF